MTDLALNYRSALGRPLTSDEVDANFQGIQDAVNGFVAPTGVGIASITITGTLATFHMTDGSTQGPFQLPVAALFWTGFYVSNHAYHELDLFQVPGDGVYLVLGDYTSPPDNTEGDSTFDPAASDTSGPLLQLMFGIPSTPPLVLRTELADFLLAPEHFGAYTRVDSAVDVNVTVPVSVGWADGAIATFRQVGAGQIIFVPESTTETTVLIITAETLKTRRDGSTASLIFVSNTTYDLAGDLEIA